MEFWQRFGLIALMAVAALVVLWLLFRALEWAADRVGIFDDPALVAGLVIAALVLAAIIAGISFAGPTKGRCGPGTRLIVDRVWTGKSYVTDEVCVVDMEEPDDRG